MAKFLLKRGSLANLKKLPVVDGQFIVIKDERAIYADIGSERVRIGDFITVANVAALPAEGANVNCLYYCVEENILAKYNGSEWVQINNDKALRALIQANSDAIAAEVLRATGAESTLQENIDAVAGNLSAEVERATGVEAGFESRIAILEDTYTDAEVDALIEGINNVIGEVEEGKTVIELIAEAQTAATYDDTEVRGLISDNAAAIDAIEADYLVEADKTELAGLISTEEARAKAAEEVNAAAIVTEKGRAESAESALQAAIDVEKGRLDAFLAAAEVGEAAVDTLKEIQSYITSDLEAADQMVKDIAANAKAISDEVTAREEAVSGLNDRVVALEEIDHPALVKEAKDHADNLNSAMNLRVVALEEIDHDKILQDAKDYADGLAVNYDAAGSAAAAESAAKTYADGLNSAMDLRVVALENYDHAALVTEAKNYADGLDTAMDTRVKALEEIDHAALIEGAVAEAKAYADGLAVNYDKVGSAAQALVDAKAYTDNALTWDDFDVQ